MSDDKKTQQKPEHKKASSAGIDPLLESLVFLTGHYGRAKSAEAIRAGLAYDEKGMGPELFCEAADRLGLKSKIIAKKDLSQISTPVLPAVVILKKDQACVLLAIKGKKASIYLPETGTSKEIAFADLQKAYAGYVIYVHPRAEFTDPEAPDLDHADRHWFWGPVRENIGLYARVIVAAVLVNLFGVVGPLFIMNVYDRVIPNNAVETGWVLAIGALTAYGFDLIMRTLRGYFIDLAGRRIDVVVTRRIYDQLLNMKLAGRPASSGAFANMLRDFDSVRDFLTSATMTGLVDLPFSLFFLFIIFLIGGPIAFMLACLMIFVIGLGMMLQWPLKVMVRKSVHAAEAKHGLLVETINGLETIKAVSADGRMRARYGVHVGDSAANAQVSRFISALGVNIATTLQMSASIIIVLMGMYLVRDSEMTMGALIACVILGGRAISPIGQVANLVARYHQARSSLKTLNEIMSLPVERPPHKQFLHRPELSGKISFDKVDFCYPKTDRKVLEQISFTINAGEKVGLIGRIGSGKSTIARMILGLYDPDEGAIYADDTDYRQIDPADLRRNIAYIAQDVVLFRGTVRENIAVSCPQASEEEILEAAKKSGVHDFISRHPMGYDAPVGERGEGLSGGQRQAIAMARAMLLQPNIMVCDEPTNAMDVQAEAAFTRHIKEQVKDKTFVLITHRQHLLALVDRLILVDQGKIIADGPRDKVIAALSQGKVEVPKE
ncbi:MAG: type I secretion system permease/ATPase [Rhodospirillales bacterium]|nr:type I secretion system permease/ATPase [Rhodospirillales bacterium]MCB9996658.1 type I secretion system permease/ATPase [Rhodospirillales bacterium]